MLQIRYRYLWLIRIHPFLRHIGGLVNRKYNPDLYCTYLNWGSASTDPVPQQKIQIRNIYSMICSNILRIPLSFITDSCCNSVRPSPSRLTCVKSCWPPRSPMTCRARSGQTTTTTQHFQDSVPSCSPRLVRGGLSFMFMGFKSRKIYQLNINYVMVNT